uniref:Peptidylglycine alpha-amidating monooxygenase n=1 Tax=Suricata suricatta TaxID=37032 RepID=A0A673TAV4_SURSU
MAGVPSLLVLLLVFPSGCLGFRSPLSVFKRFKEGTRSFSNDCIGTTRPIIPIDSSDFALDIHMPGVTPKQSDTYFCMSVRLPVDEEAFVIDFKPRASMDTVHHMLLFGCNMPSSTGSYCGTSSDEMCNLYIMYYMEARHAVSFMTCTQNVAPDMFRAIPPEASVPIPVQSDMVMMHGHHKETENKDKPSLLQQPKGEEVLEQDFHVEEALDWPGVYLLPGQVSGVALDPKNNLVIFHRGDHVWDGNSFDSMFVYQQRGLGPIEEDTILVIDPNNAAVLQSSGKNLFYLPHGLSIDKDGNYWVTDVALHQVFKLDPNSKGGPLLTLGRSMQPGSDQNHFCQPTDVAVDPDTGTIYVSDGYCNSRIVQFSPTGTFITQWGEESSGNNPKPGQFRVPHSLALVPHLGQLCVADRENGRIQCFKTDTKEFVREIRHASFGRNVFAISYIPGLLFAVNGKPYFGDPEPVQGFVMNFSSGEITDVFKPVRKHFDMPHDIAASEDGTLYVGDAHTNTVWKFTLTEKMEHRSVKKAGIEVPEIKDSEAVVENKMENKPASTELQKMQEKQKLIKEPGLGVPIVLITTLLVIPVAVLLAIALFIRWKKSKAFGDSEHKLEASSGRVLGRLRGKGSGGLNLGNFFASRKGYSRKGFDRLSTEGSDLEKEEDDGSESEEEYSAPLPAPSPSSS